MSRAAQPERVAPATPPVAGPVEASTARPAPPTEQARAGSAWSRRARKPYVLLPALLAVAVAVGFAMGALGGSGTAASSTAQVATATRGPMTQTVSAQGTVAAAQTDNLSFGSSGTVTAVNVKAGDEVQAGQVLAAIDSAQLRANVASAQSAVAKADAQLADDQASGASADRLAVDEASVAAANDQVTSAQTTLNSASLVATFDGIVSQVNVTAGEQLASNGTGGTSTTGSATGSGSSSASNGSTGSGSGGANGGFGGRNGGSGGNGGSSSSSSSGSSSSSSTSSSSSSTTPDVQVVTKNSYVVQLPVASADVNSVKVGQTATLTVTTGPSSGAFGGGRFPGFFPGAGSGTGGFGSTGQRGNGQGGAEQGGGGRSGATQGGTGQRGGSQAAAGTATATGTVTDVAQVASASTGVAQYPVTVTFTAGSKQIFVGSTVTGAIATNTLGDVLQVPARAVTTTNGTSTVTVRSNGQDETRTVKTGLAANGMVEITQGLKEGEQVVIQLPAGLRGAGSAPGGQNGVTGGGSGGSSSGGGP